MTPFNPHPDANSSSFAYLNNLPPGTNPFYTPDPALNPAGGLPRILNSPKRDPSPARKAEDLMDIDTGDEVAATSTNDAPDGGNHGGSDRTRGLKRSNPENNVNEILEHSEPIAKRRRTDSPTPATDERIPAPVIASPLDIRKKLTEAAATGDLDRLKDLMPLAQSTDQTDNDWNLIYIAAANDELAVLKWLCDRTKDFTNTSEKGYRVLQIAAKNGSLDVVKWLVEKGFDLQHRDEEGRNLLDLAAIHGNMELIEWLHSQGCAIDQETPVSKDLLNCAARSGQLELLKWLAEHGRDIDFRDSVGGDLLILAADYGHPEIVQWLIEQGCDVNYSNDYNQTALNWAIISGHLDIVRLLLEKGARIDEAADDEGNLPINVAIRATSRENSLEIIEFLLPRSDIFKRSPSGQTPFEFAGKENKARSIIPLILASLDHPKGNDLREQALAHATDPLVRDLLIQPALLTGKPLKNSQLKAGDNVVIESEFVRKEFIKKCQALTALRTHLGSPQGLTAMQAAAANVGILANLADWKLLSYPGNIFHGDISNFKEDPSRKQKFKDLLEKYNKFTSDDISLLSEQAYQWEEIHLVPVIENLFETCLRHALDDYPQREIETKLTAKGIYQPLAHRVATAWQKTWVSLAEVATPFLQPPASTTTFESWENESLADLDPTTGLIALTPDIVNNNIDRFSDTPAHAKLLRAFQANLRSELDVVGGNLFQINDPAMETSSKKLYETLMYRQFHMLAQFWRG